MNAQKNVDYSNLFASIDQVFARQLPQLTLYFNFGELLHKQQEKGAVAAAAKYLAAQYPEMSGFSPRSLRRMRAFYRAYKDQPNALHKAMDIGWTQNIVIFEANLTATEREWYINAAYRFGWSKLVLIRKITEKAHLNTTVQKPITSMPPDNHTIFNNVVNPDTYFGFFHDFKDMAVFFLRENAFPRNQRFDLKQVAYCGILKSRDVLLICQLSAQQRSWTMLSKFLNSAGAKRASISYEGWRFLFSGHEHGNLCTVDEIDGCSQKTNGS